MSKKDGGLCISIDFCKLNVTTKKDSYPLPRIQEVIESLAGAGYLSYLDLKAGFWQIATDEVLKQYTAFTVRNLGFLHMNACHLGCVTPQPYFKGNAELPGWIEPDILLNLLGWHDCLFKKRGVALTTSAHCLSLLQGTQPEAKAH